MEVHNTSNTTTYQTVDLGGSAQTSPVVTEGNKMVDSGPADLDIRKESPAKRPCWHYLLFTLAGRFIMIIITHE